MSSSLPAHQVMHAQTAYILSVNALILSDTGGTCGVDDCTVRPLHLLSPECGASSHLQPRLTPSFGVFQLRSSAECCPPCHWLWLPPQPLFLSLSSLQSSRVKEPTRHLSCGPEQQA